MTGNVHFNNVQFIRGFGRTGNVDVQFLPKVEESWVRDHLYKPSIYKSMRSDEMQLRELNELADLIAKSLSIIFERSCRSGGPTHVGKGSYYVHLQKKKKEDMGNYTSVRITSFPGKTADRAPTEGVSRQMKDKKVTDESHTVGDETSCLVDEERAVENTTLILVRHLTTSSKTSLLISCQVMDWADGPEDAWNTVWTAMTKSGVQWLKVKLVKTHQWSSSGVNTGFNTIQRFTNNIDEQD